MEEDKRKGKRRSVDNGRHKGIEDKSVGEKLEDERDAKVMREEGPVGWVG